jgi:phospholipid/cholesterol/gamma-HCH transport system substrate-binding protein
VKAFTERRPKLIGISALIVIIAVVAGILTLNRSVFSSGYQVTARFADAAGITKGTDVMVAGVKVGSVTGVTVHGNAVDAALSVNRSVLLPHETDAAVQVETLLGVVDVTLQPESGWNHPLRNGALITETSVPTELFQLQNAGQKLLSKSNTKALNSLVESLAAITKGKQSQVAQIIKGLGALTTTVDQRSGQVSQLIDSAKTLSSTLAAKDQELVSVVNDLSTVSTGLADRSSDLSNLITNVDEMATQTNSLVNGDSPALNALLSSLHTDLGVVSAHQEDLAEGVSYLGGALKGFASIADDGGQQVNWANIFVNPAGLTSTYGVIGPCGALDEALTDALGPDPVPCDEQTGPTPGEGTGPGSGSTSGSGSGSSSNSDATPGSGAPGSDSSAPSTAEGGGSSDGTLPIGPNSGLGGLSQLLSPLLGGSGQ